jgi:hypothetical protein
MKWVSYLATIISLISSIPAYSNVNPFQLPQGNYQSSCSGCTVMINNQLNCFCKDRQAMPQSTTITVRKNCIYIENINGVLTCTKRAHKHKKKHKHKKLKIMIEAGPIWNDTEAQIKCPSICEQNNGKWANVWKTTVPAQMSVCECRIRK